MLQGGAGQGATGCLGGGVARDHCGKSHDGGVATRWSAIGGGVASAPLTKAVEMQAFSFDFRNQRFKPDTGKIRKGPLHPRKIRSEEIPQSEKAENVENARNNYMAGLTPVRGYNFGCFICVISTYPNLGGFGAR